MQTKVFDDSIRRFLENIDGQSAVIKADPRILNEAAKFNVDLEALEDFGGSDKIAVIKQSRQSQDKPLENIPVQGIFDGIDVSLKEIINKIFRLSDRPIVIIRDDKIEYANKVFLKQLSLNGESDVLKEKFLKFVIKEDWNLLAENIGEMLTNGTTLDIRMAIEGNKPVKIKFEAIYVPDNQSFSFILAGEKSAAKVPAVSGLYDSVTGLPNFYLFEDRVQTAVNNENYKDVRQRRGMISVLGIGLDNYSAIKTIGMHEHVLKKLAEKLVLSLKKTYTVASGLKYQFWILLTDIQNEENLNIEVQKIKAILDEPVADNFTEHQVVASIGISIFPEPATSAKKLIEQAIMAVQKAQKEGGNKAVYFGM